MQHEDYLLHREPDDTCEVLYGDMKTPGAMSQLAPSRTGRNHSPTGFEWGYGGSGPYCTAHSILTHWLGVECPRPMAQRFKTEVIEPMPRHGGVLRRERVERWIARYSGTPTAKTA